MVVLLGLIIGFLAAIPLGPINVFAVSQALKHSFLRSLSVGLTASVLDASYCFIAIRGISHLNPIFAKYNLVIKIFCALLLLAISLRLLKQSMVYAEMNFTPKVSKNYSRPVAVTVFLYVTNPTLYAFWLAVASTITAHQWVARLAWQLDVFALSCGFGSLIWYWIIAKYVSKFHHQFKPETTRKTLIGLAVFLIGLAVYTLGTLFI